MHAAQQFAAPETIEKGKPLKDMFDERYLELFAQSFVSIVPGFHAKRFVTASLEGLDDLGIMPRGEHIATVLRRELALQGIDSASALLKLTQKSLGPKLTQTEGNGLAVFYYLPQSYVIAQVGSSALKAALGCAKELTQRFTGEFCIRPLIEFDQEQVFAELTKWVTHRSPHVRRLVSEGTRSRLPWATQLRSIREDPTPVLPFLDVLKTDDVLYVRRSVANHLGDIAKDHYQLAIEIAERWLVESKSLPSEKGVELRWVIRHSLRNPAKKNLAEALDIRQRAQN